MNNTPPTIDTSPNPTGFCNPYQFKDKTLQKPMTRFNTDCDLDEYEFIKCIRPAQGTMAATINTLFHKLVLELKRRNILSLANRQEFERFVADCVITLPSEKESNQNGNNTNSNSPTDGESRILADTPRISTGGSDRQTDAPNDNPRTSGESATNPNSSHKQSNLPSSSSGKSSGKRTKRLVSQ